MILISLHALRSMDRRIAPQLVLLACLASPLLSVHVQHIMIEANELHPTSLTPSLFVFGASMVDAGTNAYAMPFRSNAEFDPYGSDYFGGPVGRWSNGRTFMDILTQSLGLGFLDPFVQSIGSNFTHGVNFACSGSTAQNTSASSTNSGGLFSLLVQVEQFRQYQNAVLCRPQDPKDKSKLRKHFSSSIYFFEIAHNDYLQAGLDSDFTKIVKLVIAYMVEAFEVLYFLGARTFIIMNATPLGCSPAMLSNTLTLEKDDWNCTSAWNKIVNLHNHKLTRLLYEMRTKYPLAEWILFDAFSIFLDGYRDPSKYGIQYPFQACCGYGEPYNFNTNVQCGEVANYINGTYIKANKCKDPSLYLIWDSFHPVESFSKHIAQAILNGTHLIPYLDITMRFQDMIVIEEDGSHEFSIN